MNCSECFYFDESRHGGGLCRRRAPLPIHFLVPDETGILLRNRWPSVDAEDWCGEFRSNRLPQRTPRGSVDYREVAELYLKHVGRGGIREAAQEMGVSAGAMRQRISGAERRGVLTAATRGPYARRQAGPELNRPVEETQ